MNGEGGNSEISIPSHGARNLNTMPAMIDALPKVAGRILVLMDSGIRRVTDALKALALGATAVLIGRPYL